MSDKVKIYAIEDSETDLFFVKSAIEKTNTLSFFGHASNGEEALNHLRALKNLPDLILMDINMPVMNGHDCLRELRQDPRLRVIPVIIFSTSDSPIDIELSFENYASGYIIKPNTFDKYLTFIKNVEIYWSDTSLLPP